MIANFINEELREKIDNLSDVERDQVYRYLWGQHVKADVVNFCESEDIKLSEIQIDYITERYVYDGDYDCNLSYWDNIKNLTDEVRESGEQND